jgi:hypothetical protein
MMLRKLRAGLNLSRQERAIAARAWARLLVADLLLRFLPLPRVQKLLAARPRRRRGETAVPASRVLRAVDLAARHHLYPMHCLQRALVLQSMLGAYGVHTDLRLGVRREAGELRAHAWIEHEGQPLGESPDVEREFSPLASAGEGG